MVVKSWRGVKRTTSSTESPSRLFCVVEETIPLCLFTGFWERVSIRTSRPRVPHVAWTSTSDSVLKKFWIHGYSAIPRQKCHNVFLIQSHLFHQGYTQEGVILGDFTSESREGFVQRRNGKVGVPGNVVYIFWKNEMVGGSPAKASNDVGH